MKPGTDGSGIQITRTTSTPGTRATASPGVQPIGSVMGTGCPSNPQAYPATNGQQVNHVPSPDGKGGGNRAPKVSRSSNGSEAGGNW